MGILKLLGYDNEGIRGFQDDSDRIKAIGTAFPLIFFWVATPYMSYIYDWRMVEEHRTQIGTFKRPSIRHIVGFPDSHNTLFMLHS